MLSRPVPRYPPYSSHSTSTTYLPASHFLPHGLSMDPSSVDFRAFYPYTPNEVKHRKRTTTTQLRTLEAVFKRDTKPNGPLRVDLAAQLGMTARGVQVWFQNRRAKEKIKATKPPKAGEAESTDQLDSPDDVDPPLELSPELESSPPATADAPVPEVRESSTEPLISVNGPPPTLQVINEPATTSWEDSPIDPHSLYVGSNLHAYRRGSLPVNAFADTEFSSNSPPPLDGFDPMARRRSVDASLQRLASNPYAHLARAKNGAIFGSRAIAPVRHRPLGRTPYVPPPRISSSASMPYRLDMRRASLGNFRVSPHSTASSSPSPLSPYNGIRASLPDHSLYNVSPRTSSSPIPLSGPLPSPNFSFGAASTPSMISGSSSGDSERYSPDSALSYAYRENDQEEDDGMPASYYSQSRFGSIASIATSDSSFNSAYYNEATGCYSELEPDLSSRRGSFASGHFTSLMSGLDVNGVQKPTENPQDHAVYSVPEDTQTHEVAAIMSSNGHLETNNYPSPTSTVSPGPVGSPHSQGTPSVPISRSSELNHALQSQPSTARIDTTEQFFNMVVPTLAPESDISSGDQFSYSHDLSQMQATIGQGVAVDFSNKYNYDYDSTSYLTDSYPLLDNDIGLHHQAFEHSNIPYDTMTPLDVTAQHVEHYISYA